MKIDASYTNRLLTQALTLSGYVDANCHYWWDGAQAAYVVAHTSRCTCCGRLLVGEHRLVVHGAFASDLIERLLPGSARIEIEESHAQPDIIDGDHYCGDCVDRITNPEAYQFRCTRCGRVTELEDTAPIGLCYDCYDHMIECSR